jgi:hypothetical protein
MPMNVVRFSANPLVDTGSHPELGTNINGPSVLRVPDWVEKRLGNYYLYFAHHQGDYIRLAYAENVEGPYTVSNRRILPLSSTPYRGHVASPDVHVREERRTIYMYYHGDSHRCGLEARQHTSIATSTDGLSFASGDESLGRPYFRVVLWERRLLAFHGGPERYVYQADDLDGPFHPVGRLQVEGEPYTVPQPGYERGMSFRMRHPALLMGEGSLLQVYYTNVGDTPERIKRTTVDVEEALRTSLWLGSRFEEVLAPSEPYEGIAEPMRASSGGASHRAVRQLRDPYVFRDDGRTYLFYSTAGEQGIAGAEILE